MIFTSCYKLNSDASTTTVVTVSGTYTIGSTDSDYTFTSASSCNLDEANGKILYFVLLAQIYSWKSRQEGS